MKSRPRHRTGGLSLACAFLALGSALATASRSSGPHDLVVKIDVTTHPPATRAQENAVAHALQANPRVRKLVFESKAAALAAIKKKDPALVKGLPYNPLPDSITVTPTKSEYARELAKGLLSLPGVQTVIAGHS